MYPLIDLDACRQAGLPLLAFAAEILALRPVALQLRAKGAGAREYFYPSGVELPGDNAQFAVKALDWASLNYRSAPVVQAR